MKAEILKWGGQPTRSGRVKQLQENDHCSPRSIRQAARDRQIWNQINAEQNGSTRLHHDIHRLKQQIKQLEQQIKQLEQQIKLLKQKNNDWKEKYATATGRLERPKLRTDRCQYPHIFTTTEIARHGGQRKDKKEPTYEPMSWKKVKTYS